MIPKIIHYCWFGKGPKSQLINKCIESWKKFLPEYKIIEWNEDNFEIKKYTFAKQAYQKKKWAFVSDYVRLFALYNYGGIYLDTDVEILKSLDLFLQEKFFSGFESKDFPVTAVMGAIPQHKLLGELLSIYDKMSFINENGDLNIKPNTYLLADTIKLRGILPNGKQQSINEITIYPQIYFCPNNFSRIWNIPSPKSFAIHHFDQSWRDDNRRNFMKFWGRVRRYIVGVLKNTVGINGINKIKGLQK